MAPTPSAPTTADSRSGPVTDIVLEGGGVKGIALVGALQPLAEAGYSFARVAGTSAGALVGSVLAAMQKRGEPISRLDEIASTLDYTKFRDRGPAGRLLSHLPGPFGLLVDAVSVLIESGAYEGDYLRDWVKGVLAEFDVHTFGDLLLDDPGGDGEMHHRYRLVVMASDLSRHRLTHLPWDYHVYGLDPDEQLVCDAVHASAATPFLFEPVQLKGTRGTATLVDGGLVSNYPITIFDRADESLPRWPTIGVRLDALDLSGQEVRAQTRIDPVSDPVRLGVALVETAIEGCQAEHVLEPCNLARSINVDTTAVDSFDFGVTAAQQQLLLDHGRAAATEFLAGWDYAAWLAHCRLGAAARLEQ